MTMQRFAVELKRRTVGIAVRLGGGFVFYASDKTFQEMDGRTFPRARTIERELKKIANRGKREMEGLRAARAFA